jgi:Tol biopolymer transport system component
MTPATQRAAGLWACTTLIWLTADRSPVVTVPQADGLRSARAARTVDVSADGRYVAFESWARLVAADTDTQPDVYVLDRSTGNVTLESVDPGDGQATYPRLSGDGRLVVFEWRVAAGAVGVDIVCRDRLTLVSRSLTGLAGRGAAAWSRHPAISANGTIAAFSSASTTLVRGVDANGLREDIYTFDLASGEMRRASLTTDGVQPPAGDSISPSLSADGRWLAFASTAPLDPAAKTGSADRPRRIFLRDLLRGTTRLVSRARGGAAANGDSSYPAVSADGRFVAFASDASNLVSGDDRNRGADVFLFDRETEAIARVSRGADGSSPSGVSIHPAISADGRYIAFQSDAPNLVCADACRGRDGDINLLWDVFLFDRVTGRTRRLSEDELGGWMEWSGGPAIDGAGEVVAFSSRQATGPEDRRDDLDLFVQRVVPPRPRRPPP